MLKGSHNLWIPMVRAGLEDLRAAGVKEKPGQLVAEARGRRATHLPRYLHVHAGPDLPLPQVPEGRRRRRRDGSSRARLCGAWQPNVRWATAPNMSATAGCVIDKCFLVNNDRINESPEGSMYSLPLHCAEAKDFLARRDCGDSVSLPPMDELGAATLSFEPRDDRLSDFLHFPDFMGTARCVYVRLEFFIWSNRGIAPSRRNGSSFGTPLIKLERIHHLGR